jgi:hypothetical protein
VRQRGALVSDDRGEQLIVCSPHPSAIDFPSGTVRKPRFEPANLLSCFFVSSLCRKAQPTTVAL